MVRLLAIAALVLLHVSSSFAYVENYEGGKDDFIPFLDTEFVSAQRKAQSSSPMKALFFVSSLVDFAADLSDNPHNLPDVRGLLPAYRTAIKKEYPGTKVKIVGLEKEDGGAGVWTLVIFPEKCTAKPSSSGAARSLMKKLSNTKAIKALFPPKAFGRVHMEHISTPHWVSEDGKSLSAESKSVKSLSRALMFGAAIFDRSPKWFTEERQALFMKLIKIRVPGSKVSMRVTIDDGYDENNRAKAIANVLLEVKGVSEKKMQKLKKRVEYAASTIWKRKRWGRVHVEGGVRLGWTGASCKAPVKINGCCKVSFKAIVPNISASKFNKDPAGCNNCSGEMEQALQDKLLDPQNKDAEASIEINATPGSDGSTDVIVNITVDPDLSDNLTDLVDELDKDPALVFPPDQWGEVDIEPPPPSPSPSPSPPPPSPPPPVPPPPPPPTTCPTNYCPSGELCHLTSGYASCCIEMMSYGTFAATTNRLGTFASVYPAPASFAGSWTSALAVAVYSDNSGKLSATTPFGAVYGSSKFSSYALIDARSTGLATFTFDVPTVVGFGFALCDVDSESVIVDALDADGNVLTAAQLGFQVSFNNGNDPDMPTWNPSLKKLVGNGPDTDGACGWLKPTLPIKTLRLTSEKIVGFPKYQLWFAAPQCSPPPI